MSVLAPLLSSTVRPKESHAGRPIVMEAQSVNAFVFNEVLLLNALPYNVMHAARMLTEKATGEGWSLARFRERVLRAAAESLSTPGERPSWSTARSPRSGDLAADRRLRVGGLTRNPASRLARATARRRSAGKGECVPAERMHGHAFIINPALFTARTGS